MRPAKRTLREILLHVSRGKVMQLKHDAGNNA